MNFNDEIKKMQEIRTISTRLQATDYARALLRDIPRQFELAEALFISSDRHMARVKSGFDPRMN